MRASAAGGVGGGASAAGGVGGGASFAAPHVLADALLARVDDSQDEVRVEVLNSLAALRALQLETGYCRQGSRAGEWDAER